MVVLCLGESANIITTYSNVPFNLLTGNLAFRSIFKSLISVTDEIQSAVITTDSNIMYHNNVISGKCYYKKIKKINLN